MKFASFIAAALVATASPALAENITVIVLSDRPVEKVLFPGDGRTQMMTLEEFQVLHPQFADADLTTIIPAGTEVLQPIGGETS